MRLSDKMRIRRWNLRADVGDRVIVRRGADDRVRVSRRATVWLACVRVSRRAAVRLADKGRVGRAHGVGAEELAVRDSMSRNRSGTSRVGVDRSGRCSTCTREWMGWRRLVLVHGSEGSGSCTRRVDVVHAVIDVRVRRTDCRRRRRARLRLVRARTRALAHAGKSDCTHVNTIDYSWGIVDAS